jgi:hypothetical protein
MSAKLSCFAVIALLLMLSACKQRGTQQAPEHFRYGTKQKGQRTAVSVEATRRTSIAQGANVFPIRNVVGPNNRRWRPRRHFGPFLSGSDLPQIQVWLRHEGNDTVRANWYHNSFHSTHEDAADIAIYQKYYPNNVLPSEATPAVLTTFPNRSQVPGTPPACDGCLNDVLFALHSVHFSSRYGGSVRLAFQVMEDTEYELRRGQLLWDLSDLSMSVFVVPEKASLNPLTPALAGRGIVRIEFGWRPMPTAYDLSTRDVKPQTDFSDVDTAMRAIASKLETDQDSGGFLVSAASFAHAFLHVQHQQMIAPDDLVDEIDISDDHVLLTTHKRQPVIRLLVRSGRIEGPTSGYHELENEFVVTISSKHVYGQNTQNAVVTGPTRDFRVPHDGGSGFGNFGTWIVDSDPPCEDIVAAELSVQVVEKDPAWDDNFSAVSVLAPLPACDEIRAATSTNPPFYGVFDEGGSWDDLKQGGDTWGQVYTNWHVFIDYK